MPNEAVRVKIDDRAVKRLLKERFPRELNREMNRSHARITREFGKQFTREKLRRGIFQVKRSVRLKPARRGTPTIPAKMRKAGFVVRSKNLKRIEGKGFNVSTSNPLLTIREKGGVIRPRRARALFIRGEFRGRGAKQKRALARVGAIKRPIIAVVQAVRQPAVLGFVALWNRFAPQRRSIQRDGLRKAVRAANRRAARAA